ncbi:Translation release factor pelota like protein [Aduncisulcus paluster]|uniref:Protein pelota homolog n=1 Tax=Aduncisulcus paluster TaxID=2918883 RepID=A0ABQ5JTW3_9EUKA|nr:Translation release factor pelota like protein [Aduncisulcus paluster]|eukprot:gnl/Carplike_NY0171/2464_a3313_768.p1 GENE.gnl/Carplike_NY0171/2464_a3313_768~~gnl/Carplike_NY0171/2464_a3313_768.p1  ORF type:complete len:393 (+),score=78.84 gnl/Carplike_NY0171/2464_a3313_768:49-1227(+)
MKILKGEAIPQEITTVSVIPEREPDLWCLYNIIEDGDTIFATTTRKVQKSQSKEGSERVKVKLCLEVKGVEYNPGDQVLRISGINKTESKHIKLGQYHTFSLSLLSTLKITKKWTHYHAHSFRLVSDIVHYAQIAVLLIIEGRAQLVLVADDCSVVKAKIEHPIPHKSKFSNEKRSKAFNSFYNSTLLAVVQTLRQGSKLPRCLVIGSPDASGEQFKSYALSTVMSLPALSSHTTKVEMKTFIEDSILLLTSTGFKHAIKEIFTDPSTKHLVADTAAAHDIALIEKMRHMIEDDDERLVYGESAVMGAADLDAISTLMVTDELMRSQDLEQRRRMHHLYDRVIHNGGKVTVMNTEHEGSGGRLKSLSGLAAILLFPVPGLMEAEDSEEDSFD